MSFESTKGLGHGGAGMHGDGPRKLFAELQGLTTRVVSGAAAATDIPVTGIAVGDTIQSVLSFTGGVPSLVATNTVTVKAGAISLSGASTGAVLVVNYYRKAGPV